MKRLLRLELAELLAVAEADDVIAVVGAGDDVVKVVVGAGEGEDGVVMVIGVVVCCAATVRGDSHVARSTNPAAMTTKTTIDNFSKARVCSVISPPSGSLTVRTIALLRTFRHKHPSYRMRHRVSRRRLYPLGKPALYPM